MFSIVAAEASDIVRTSFTVTRIVFVPSAILGCGERDAANELSVVESFGATLEGVFVPIVIILVPDLKTTTTTVSVTEGLWAGGTVLVGELAPAAVVLVLGFTATWMVVVPVYMVLMTQIPGTVTVFVTTTVVVGVTTSYMGHLLAGSYRPIDL